jgi:hypothetical protein
MVFYFILFFHYKKSMEYNEDLEFISKKTKLNIVKYIFNLLPETTSKELKQILHYELMYSCLYSGC